MLNKTASIIEHKNERLMVKTIYNRSSSNYYGEYSLNFLNDNIYIMKFKTINNIRISNYLNKSILIISSKINLKLNFKACKHQSN